jgi:hypothetical protein
MRFVVVVYIIQIRKRFITENWSSKNICFIFRTPQVHSRFQGWLHWSLPFWFHLGIHVIFFIVVSWKCFNCQCYSCRIPRTQFGRSRDSELNQEEEKEW